MELNLKRIGAIKDWLLDILFPQKCFRCQSKGEPLCSSCIFSIRRAERETSQDILACFDYRDETIRKIIWDLKYHHNFSLGKKLGELMYETLLEDISEIRTYSQGQKILVIPVPISDDKTKLRGYNQAEKIAKGFCNSAEKDLFEIKNNIITKKINSTPQARISNRTKRLNNVKGVFEIKNRECIKNRTIIIIDDVTTTGGTITEIIKVLKKAGAQKVIGFAVAH